MYTILLVDDSEDVRKMLKNLVFRHFSDVEVMEAANENDLNMAISDHVPDFIFMDIGLPGTNGLKLTKQIKDKHCSIPIAIFTNYDYPEYRAEAFENGADFYLSKTESTENEIISLIRNEKTPIVRH